MNTVLNWGMRNYWVALVCDGHKHAIIIEARTAVEARALGAIRFPGCTILYVELAKGWD